MHLMTWPAMLFSLQRTPSMLDGNGTATSALQQKHFPSDPKLL